VATVEGAIQAGIGFFVTSQLLTYLPARFGGSSLVIVLFAFGALQYAKHPRGVFEFQKRRGTSGSSDCSSPRSTTRCIPPNSLRGCQWLSPLLSLRGVSKSFGGIHAVHDISFDVAPGESVGLVGPNGAGKTTLFNCVCGQLRHDAGEILFEGARWPACPPSSGPAWASGAPTRRSRCSPT
jgi:ABC-type transport system involved in cytochrome bd biosynthesis fused ATPase/permease subunit